MPLSGRFEIGSKMLLALFFDHFGKMLWFQQGNFANAKALGAFRFFASPIRIIECRESNDLP
jgi:hypothetical protein